MLAHVRERVGLPVPPTRDAATIVLLRDTRAGWRLSAAARGSMAFAAGMHVFPGGRVDPADTDGSRELVRHEPRSVVGRAQRRSAARSRPGFAAVRETFEESGVLLAGAGPDDVVDVSGPNGRRSGSRCSIAARACPACSTPRPWPARRSAAAVGALDHPGARARRYDTRFFVAAFPPASTPVTSAAKPTPRCGSRRPRPSPDSSATSCR